MDFGIIKIGGFEDQLSRLMGCLVLSKSVILTFCKMGVCACVRYLAGRATERMS